ncbi:[FeFe] hydrogenase H-cluster radical SAM maturase HydE [Adlercreutzia sp. ZJ141]|uniref:[FeFe] hydrogenase H-cluster radical SAM maturase HydE n=1 Tax=Adlercreutzia sp. ZJ141 TaxID=2709406 RepID=UPI0013EA12D2|nr:[FeFe] hydrogenase H-cluster radical SAM maturase HydE [Adlercreutzia sp. ZJ141]
MSSTRYLVDKLAEERRLSVEQYEQIILNRSPELAAHARELACAQRKAAYGTSVFIRGLIEVSNYCKNDCYYCGIRKSNASCSRYRLSADDIFDCAQTAYDLGCRTFVLQGGEDPWFTDQRVAEIIGQLKHRYPDCAITLSLGERSFESYQALRQAGADRYLLRHETASARHYQMLHPADLALQNRLRCLSDLRDLGFAVGSGFMVGTPGQTAYELACDLKLIEELQPAMCGIGPFVPHHATPFANEPQGSAELTCFLLSLLRIMRPSLLLPSTTALNSIQTAGMEQGILAGANVIMPNLSPFSCRSKYEIYDNKVFGIEDAAAQLESLRKRIRAIGYEIVTDRGDPQAPA